MKKYKAILCLAGATVIVPAAYAQAVPANSDDAASSAAGVSDIVVTAQKRAQSLSTVPMSVTALTGDQLAARGISDVQDLAKVTPGFNFVQSGSGVPVYSLRGVGFYDTAVGARPTVSVYVDEAPLPFSVMTSGAAFDLERVEVLKGPQGTLFGQNATGGAINYIAAKPKDQLHAGITASFARFNTLDTQAYITGPLAPGLNARLAVRGVRGDEWQQSYTRDDELGRQRFLQGRFLLDWEASDRFKLSLNLNGFIDKSDTQAGQLIAITPLFTPFSGTIPLVTNYPHSPETPRAADWDPNTLYRKNNKFFQAVVRADYELTDNITLVSLNSYAHMKMRQHVDLDGTALPNGELTVGGRLTSFSTEERLTGNFGPATIIFGLNYAYDKTREDSIWGTYYSTQNSLFTPTTNDSAAAPYGYQNFNTYAAFGNIDYDIGRLITLHAGARYTKADLSYEGCGRPANLNSAVSATRLFSMFRGSFGLGPIPFIGVDRCMALDAQLAFTPHIAGTFNEDSLSWRAGIDIKPAERVLLYFNASRGYKAGSVPVISGTSADQYRPVKQETVLALEAGFKASLLDRHMDVTGAVFNYDYSDKQLQGRINTLLGTFLALVNVPKSRVRGFETQVSVYPVNGLTLTAAATYLESKVTSDFVNYTMIGNRQNFKGNEFPYTPKWQLNLDGTYKFPISSDLDANLGANYTYRTKTNAGFGNEPILYMKNYGTLDLRAGFGSNDGNWQVSVFGRNVMNTYYWTNVAKMYDVVRRIAGQPATYGVQFNWKF
ncbi:TonB-dependent receptor [Sphingobium chlorophenolicum]|uniref:TonB-dependent receptor plug n=1 Tax=Sphingobium chlorophenolicum TaxID=46429 RepID=A0A081RAW5_SPHCR|nr:TonB-dependent receptor [Sphingobium chlorophenolicum]KEQ52338.1 TonB-dependent receptor plug precursor [Sphingobium chlorophenolicum]